jgi:hypothetical protein
MVALWFFFKLNGLNKQGSSPGSAGVVARPRWGELPRATPFERGRYLASITCSECHGLDFRDNEFEDNTCDGGPSLAIVAMYGRDEFRRLMRTGEPIGDRELGEMSRVARIGFVHFRDEEIEGIRTFLREHHGLPQEPPE